MSAHQLRDIPPDELPSFLRVDEVARLLRISRSAAYELANAWLAPTARPASPRCDSAEAFASRVPQSCAC